MTITNTGKRAGAEVAQVYVAAPAAAGEAPKQLKGYQKVFLDPGQAASATVPLDNRAFAQWDTNDHTWHITPGIYQVLVGSSSRDIRAQSSLRMPAQTLAP
jgi:beta-glucosidase